MAVKKNNKRASDILTFWFDETPPDHWFNGGDAFDALLRRRFSMDVQRALGGHYDDWAGRRTAVSPSFCCSTK